MTIHFLCGWNFPAFYFSFIFFFVTAVANICFGLEWQTIETVNLGNPSVREKSSKKKKETDDARQAILKIHPLKKPESNFARWQRDANSITTS